MQSLFFDGKWLKVSMEGPSNAGVWTCKIAMCPMRGWAVAGSWEVTHGNHMEREST